MSDREKLQIVIDQCSELRRILMYLVRVTALDIRYRGFVDRVPLTDDQLSELGHFVKINCDLPLLPDSDVWRTWTKSE